MGGGDSCDRGMPRSHADCRRGGDRTRQCVSVDRRGTSPERSGSAARLHRNRACLVPGQPSSSALPRDLGSKELAKREVTSGGATRTAELPRFRSMAAARLVRRCSSASWNNWGLIWRRSSSFGDLPQPRFSRGRRAIRIVPAGPVWMGRTKDDPSDHDVSAPLARNIFARSREWAKGSLSPTRLKANFRVADHTFPIRPTRPEACRYPGLPAANGTSTLFSRRLPAQLIAELE